jgi:DNA polymerase delta subunit 1
MVVFQAIAWEGKDSDGEAYIIKIFGRTEDGKSVCLSTKFRPYFFVKSREGSQKFIKEPVVHAASVKGKELWGFTNNQECVFVKLDFHTLKAMKEHERVLKRSYQIYESNIDPVLRFMHRTNISSTGWLDSGPECERAYISTCDIDLWCNNWKSLTPVARDDIAPLRIMSFDIEAYSHDGGFPDPEHPENVVFQIGMTTKVYGQEGWFDRKCLCLKQTDAEDCESFEKEEDLLEAFAKYLVKTDPDIITGYNIFGFDLEFLMKRMRILPVTPTACFWTRLRDRSVQLVEKTLSSNALGSNQLKMVPMAGRYVFDLFQDIKREHKLESYSLNAVSKEFLKDQKNDMPVREIFRRYKDGDPKELGEVAEYCIKDTELPHALMKKLFTIENLTEMAKATWVPLSFLSERGQQIKVFSQLSRKARELGFMIPVMRVNGNDDKYQGATVLDAQTGAYYAPITALDFASLYPSIMCAHNLCYSTMVMEPKYDNLPGVTYEQFGQFRFAQNVPSLLPAILTELKQFRKKAKKLMAQSEKTPMYGVYNGQQLAYKISMNSVYGFTGASKGMLPLVAIASTVTMRGRQMIEETKNYVEANFPGAKVRYGDTDSVMVEFDVGGRTGQEAIDYSWQLGEQASEQCTKLFKEPNELELEKIYCPYFLYSKKRYAAKMYEGASDKEGRPILKDDGTRLVVFKKIDVKGLQVVRRDNCPYVREVCKDILATILETSDPLPSIEKARTAAKNLKAGLVPMEKLTMSKQLGADYKSKSLAHVAVVAKMRERMPGSEPQQGDRVPFVIVQGPKNAKMFERAEDPQYVREHKLKLDFDYYFENQLKNPVCDLLEPLVGDTKVIFEKPTKKISDFFKPV